MLVYLGVSTQSEAERAAMASLVLITIATLMFGWWNRRGVLRSRATAIGDYVAISAERIRRMRMAYRLDRAGGASGGVQRLGVGAA